MGGGGGVNYKEHYGCQYSVNCDLRLTSGGDNEYVDPHIPIQINP